MTRPIGEIFEDNGVKLEVVKSGGCDGCYYKEPNCHLDAKLLRIHGLCTSCDRKDRTSVKFVKVNGAEGKR